MQPIYGRLEYMKFDIVKCCKLHCKQSLLIENISASSRVYFLAIVPAESRLEKLFLVIYILQLYAHNSLRTKTHSIAARKPEVKSFVTLNYTNNDP